MDDALLSISQASRGQLVKMSITFETHGIFYDQILHTYLFLQCLATGLQNGNVAAGRIQNVENCPKSQNLCKIEKYANQNYQ